MSERKCKVYGCDRPVKNWRWQCCCLNHTAIYAANVRYGRVGQRTISNDPEYKRAISAARLQRVRDATPSWADKQAINEIYNTARRMTMETGELYEVDHVVPLRGKLVCGLHIETNLRIVHSTVNRQKTNKWDIE